jgi:hypothetical protein
MYVCIYVYLYQVGSGTGRLQLRRPRLRRLRPPRPRPPCPRPHLRRQARPRRVSRACGPGRTQAATQVRAAAVAAEGVGGGEGEGGGGLLPKARGTLSTPAPQRHPVRMPGLGTGNRARGSVRNRRSWLVLDHGFDFC